MHPPIRRSVAILALLKHQLLMVADVSGFACAKGGSAASTINEQQKALRIRAPVLIRCAGITFDPAAALAAGLPIALCAQSGIGSHTEDIRPEVIAFGRREFAHAYVSASSWPGLSRPSISKDVDTRDKPRHDKFVEIRNPSKTAYATALRLQNPATLPCRSY